MLKLVLAATLSSLVLCSGASARSQAVTVPQFLKQVEAYLATRLPESPRPGLTVVKAEARGSRMYVYSHVAVYKANFDRSRIPLLKAVLQALVCHGKLQHLARKGATFTYVFYDSNSQIVAQLSSQRCS